VTPLHRRVVTRSLVSLLADSPERTELLTALAQLADEDDAPSGLPDDASGLGAAALAVVELLRNPDADRFEELFRALPAEIVAVLAALSPRQRCAGVRAPVELVVPPRDLYFPLSEARALAESLPSARLTVTSLLDHTRPQLSLARLADLRSFDSFVVRGLAAAAA
jgi:hypothetical protein